MPKVTRKQTTRKAMRKNSLTVLMLTVLTVVGVMTACNRMPLYSHYEHMPATGWEKSEGVAFDISPVAQAGNYREELGLRIDGDYPFQGLCLVVQQTILPSGYRHNDTIDCSLFDKNGRVKGYGINHYQYSFHINTLRLTEGDSLHILVKHNMKREIMPGITDIGIQIEKE